MIKIFAGGKKPSAEFAPALQDYTKRLHKPYQIEWQFMDEAKLTKFLTDWPFSHHKHYVICCDKRGENISSDAYSARLSAALTAGKSVVILIGGAYGFPAAVRQQADFVWSFSRLVFPHQLARLIVAEQTYRAAQIALGTPYHHA